MLSDNELKRIDNEERDINRSRLKAEVETEQGKNKERSVQFVKKVVFISIITMGIVLGVLGSSLLIFVFQMLG